VCVFFLISVVRTRFKEEPFIICCTIFDIEFVVISVSSSSFVFCLVGLWFELFFGDFGVGFNKLESRL